MYEELVKTLRQQCADMDCGNCNTCVKRQAADAVEGLEGKLFLMKKTAEWLSEKIPKWIPVTERLPEEKINPNTRDFEYVLCTTIWGDVRPFKYGAPIGSTESHFWNGAGYVDAYVTHWMPLPEPPKEET